MTPSQIRVDLLEQHAALREMIRETRQAAERAQQGDLQLEDLRILAIRLVGGLRAHNRQEEELLRGIIFTIDAWGPQRAAILSDEHVKEHDELEGLLVLASAGSDAAAVDCLVAGLDRILAHMAREEQTVLGSELLRDDGISIDYFGG